MDISIKKPCHENWDNMTPDAQGAFCHKCVKSVVDFSEKTIEEIKEFFAGKKSNERICGRFKNEQMIELSFDAYFSRFKGFSFTRKMAIVLYFTFGVWLFSAPASHAQSTAHLTGDVEVEQVSATKKGKIKVVKNDSVCMSQTTSENERAIMGKVVMPESDCRKKRLRTVKDASMAIKARMPDETMKGEVKSGPPNKK